MKKKFLLYVTKLSVIHIFLIFLLYGAAMYYGSLLFGA